jgi:hypothetical protein
MRNLSRECKDNNAVTVKRTAPQRKAGIVEIRDEYCAPTLFCTAIWREKKLDNPTEIDIIIFTLERSLAWEVHAETAARRL